MATAAIEILTMLDISNPILWLIGVIALAVVLFLLRRHFSTEARARRRREKSNRPVISRKQGPTVRLAVDVGKPKRDRKR
jgi:beta-lactamase regulating signal transducer with metallopeptidase domain